MYFRAKEEGAGWVCLRVWGAEDVTLYSNKVPNSDYEGTNCAEVVYNEAIASGLEQIIRLDDVDGDVVYYSEATFDGSVVGLCVPYECERVKDGTDKHTC